MIAEAKRSFALAKRLPSRFSSQCMFAMLVVASCSPLFSATNKADLAAPAIAVANTPCPTVGCMESLALAQGWNSSIAVVNPPHHFPNILVDITCFGWCHSPAQNQAWLADHVDSSVFGNVSDMDNTVAMNPQLTGYAYALLWYTLDDSTPDPYNLGDKWQHDLASWAAARGFGQEQFYLHTAVPTAKCASPALTSACRLNTNWGSQTDWYGNLANPHFIEYTQSRAQRMIGSRESRESIFWDTMDSGGLHAHSCGANFPSLEYGNSCDLYEQNLIQLVVKVREALGGRLVQVNTAGYTSAVDPYNGSVAIAAGSIQAEGMNSPFGEYSELWSYIDDMLAAGVTVAFTADWYTQESELTGLGKWSQWKTSYTGGNYPSGLSRYEMTTLAQHYMLTPSPLAGNFYWNPNPQDWSVAYPKQWLPAVEVDLGPPVDSSRVLAGSGYDGAGQSYDLYRREFSRAYVYARPMKKYTNTAWDDSTAIPILLPEENLSLLKQNGRSTPVHGNSIWLRNGEGVILLRSTDIAAGVR